MTTRTLNENRIGIGLTCTCGARMFESSCYACGRSVTEVARTLTRQVQPNQDPITLRCSACGELLELDRDEPAKCPECGEPVLVNKAMSVPSGDRQKRKGSKEVR